MQQKTRPRPPRMLSALLLAALLCCGTAALAAETGMAEPPAASPEAAEPDADFEILAEEDDSDAPETGGPRPGEARGLLLFTALTAAGSALAAGLLTIGVAAARRN